MNAIIKSIRRIIIGLTITGLALVVFFNVAYANGMFDEFIQMYNSFNGIMEIL